jgi:hypothetical protein
MRLDTSYPSLATSRSFLLETANAIIQGFKISTPESIISYHALNCIHQVLPLSLSRQPLNNEQHLAYSTPMMPAFKGLHVKVKNTIVDEEARQVAMHASSTATTDFGDYNNEYILADRSSILSYASIERVYAYEVIRPNSRKLVQEGDEGFIGNSIETNIRPS